MSAVPGAPSLFNIDPSGELFNCLPEYGFLFFGKKQKPESRSLKLTYIRNPSALSLFH
jgi:hypothetical protein